MGMGLAPSPGCTLRDSNPGFGQIASHPKNVTESPSVRSASIDVITLSYHVDRDPDGELEVVPRHHHRLEYMMPVAGVDFVHQRTPEGLDFRTSYIPSVPFPQSRRLGRPQCCSAHSDESLAEVSDWPPAGVFLVLGRGRLVLDLRDNALHVLKLTVTFLDLCLMGFDLLLDPAQLLPSLSFLLPDDQQSSILLLFTSVVSSFLNHVLSLSFLKLDILNVNEIVWARGSRRREWLLSSGTVSQFTVLWEHPDLLVITASERVS